MYSTSTTTESRTDFPTGGRGQSHKSPHTQHPPLTEPTQVTRPAPFSHRDPLRECTSDPFRPRFGQNLPVGLREEAAGMDWRTFTGIYCPTPDLRIDGLTHTLLRDNRRRFTATLTSSRPGRGGVTHSHREIVAMGAVSACTNLLADAGRRVEILTFRQREIFNGTAVFLEVCDNRNRCWVLGFGGTPDAAVASAMSRAAHRLHRGID
ncbi:acetyl-CoA acetyltransferase [Corynebacterium sp. P7003]|uniref:Acetyl-CoA acetyltransferase n=1 Tax=Corynebacterium pygosceleis TaxID=2800406 RepID=A0ABT3WTG9_9CORY|nr:acetyl-CoA acetyltransferase [Corynebacterium pygosceleis]MCX7445446.1 acetyl-CoA acetyltransferase [Corynebacterium pygosceleis]